MSDLFGEQLRPARALNGHSGSAPGGSFEVQVTVAAGPNDARTRPPTDGPFELAWVHILDWIFAHSVRNGVAVVRFVLPGDELVPFVSMRAEACRLLRRPGGGSAVALLAQHRFFPEDADYLYLLHHGRLAPPALRRLRHDSPPGWRLLDSCSYFTVGARLLGVPIRLAYLLGRADLADRSMTMMRRRFSRPGISPAYYHLTAWMRP